MIYDKMSLTLLNLLLNAYMTGVIWLIQLSVYPGFRDISSNIFVATHTRHTATMTWLVGPVMILEVIVASLMLIQLRTFEVGLNLSLVIILWGITFFISVPLHNQLAGGFDLNKINSLIMSNWLRTLIWTSRIFIGLYIFNQIKQSQ